MSQILQDQPMTIFGDGTQSRAFTYIDDVAPVMAAAVDEPGAWNQVFNVGADRPWPLSVLAERVGAAMGVTARTYLPARHEVPHAHASHEKLQRVFGRHAPISLDDGLAAMAAWVKQQGARSSPAFEGIEVMKNLPPSWKERS